MTFIRRLRWMIRNWRYQWISVAEDGVFVFDVGAEVHGVHVDGPAADSLRADLEDIYAGRRWDATHGRWIESMR